MLARQPIIQHPFWSCATCEYQRCGIPDGARITWCDMCLDNELAYWNAVFETYTGTGGNRGVR